ncbi:1,3-beta-glucanosyltransferase [Histoplasma capsulatum H143]|uniref:1,3-beta-glucanosyltransferase n=1 Tax=Ajellomyces capsulatus (strain H143) TaxID=544712 RepID=C6HB49_AJECH|nr:1,3-beta-glucanosyltransferase [Histoplasma capsulatum H143]
MWSRSASFAAVVGTYLLLLVHDVLAISKLSAVGSKFFNEEGQQFFVKGIAYQLTPKDPLVDSEQCKLDSSLMKELGANAIRVYHVDPEGDHEECMKTFADAGIYLFVDLDDFPTQIEGKSPIWSQRQFDAFKLTLDEFQKYDNTAGVFVGNEVLTTANDSIAAPYILSATRDIKAYRDSKNYRKIPVGYSAADIAELRPMLQNYLVCREDESERLDFFALNAYEWCAAEGDKSNPSALDGFSRRGTPTPIKPDFTNLKSRFASLSPTGVELSDYSRQASKITAPPCPSSTPHSWDVDPSADLPSIGQSGVGQTNPTSTRGEASGEASGKASATPSSSSAGNRQMPILGFLMKKVHGSKCIYRFFGRYQPNDVSVTRTHTRYTEVQDKPFLHTIVRLPAFSMSVPLGKQS